MKHKYNFFGPVTLEGHLILKYQFTERFKASSNEYLKLVS